MSNNFVVLEELTSEEKLQKAIEITKNRITAAEIYFKANADIPGSMGWAAFSKAIAEDKIILEVLEEYKNISNI